MYLRRLVARIRLGRWYAAAAKRLVDDPRASLVLRYHSVGRREEVESYVSPGISLEPERFEQHVRHLADRFDVIGLDDALARAATGRPPGSRPGVVLTFDDGYRDNHRHAVPILRRYGVPATIYVVAGAIDPAPVIWTVRVRSWIRRFGDASGRLRVPAGAAPAGLEGKLAGGTELNRWLRALSREERERALEEIESRLGAVRTPTSVMMNPEELRACAADGVTIGAHTVSHPLLPAIEDEEAEREIRESRSILESALDAPVVHFSYPNPGGGEHENARVRALVARAGFRTATTSQSGMVTSGVDRFRIRRWGINAGWQERLLFRRLGEPSVGR